MTDQDNEQRLKNKALQLLSRREHGKEELRRKLTATESDADLVAELLLWLQEQDWLSDERFAQQFVRSKSYSGYGPIRIRMDLRQKGVENTIIERALEQAEVSWLEQARSVWSKKFHKPAKNWQEKAKQQRFLAYRGFEDKQIRFALGGETDEYEYQD